MVRRFDHEGYPDDNGMFVEFADYQAVIAEEQRLTMALRNIHSLPISDSDTLEGFAGAVRALCWEALEPASTRHQTPLSQSEHESLDKGLRKSVRKVDEPLKERRAIDKPLPWDLNDGVDYD